MEKIMASASPAPKKSVTPAKKATTASVKLAAKKSPTAPVAKPAPIQAEKPAAVKAEKKKSKTEKVKVVRDSFTIPKSEYAQIAIMKKRAMDLGFEVKKSELIRAGLALLTNTTDSAFRKAMGNVPTLKTGRPGKA